MDHAQQIPGIHHPIVLGSDGCGTVESVEGGDTSWVGAVSSSIPPLIGEKTHVSKALTLPFWVYLVMAHSPNILTYLWTILDPPPNT